MRIGECEVKNKRKLFYVSAATAVVSAALAGGVSAQTSFPDVTPKNSHYEAITALAEQGVVSSYFGNEFWPNAPVTRGQAAEMIVKAFNLASLDPKPHNFSDVGDFDETAPYIATLKNLGIVNGYPDGTFGVDKEISRAQMAKMIALAIDLQPKGKHPFTDTYKDEATDKYIAALYEKKITVGTSPTKFSPRKHVTRAQMASFLYRAQVHAPDNPYTLSVLHTNDIHSRAETYPKIFSALFETRNARPNSLLLDAGDALTGTLYFNEFLGEVESRFMSAFNYDAMTFGNHEFDLGSSPEGHLKLKEYVAESSHPFVSANVNFDKDPLFKGIYNNIYTNKPEEGKIYAGIMKDVGGEKIGIFGLTTEETVGISSPGSITFDNYIKKAEEAVDAFEKQGINKIIALTHLGYDDNPVVDNDLMLAKSVEGIDIIVGGHSHTQLDEPVKITSTATGEAKDPTLIVQAYQYGDYLGTLDVQFNDEGVVLEHRGSLVKIADFPAHPLITDVLEEYKDRIDAVGKEEIGLSLENALPNPRSSEDNPTAPSVRSTETILGNLITDGMLNKAKNYSTEPVIMAVQNGGGIRAAIDAGPVTVGEVITVLPFGNTLATMKLTGAEVKEMFERSVRSAPREDGAFLHVSGAKVTYDSSKAAGERVVSIQYINDAGEYVDIDPAASYVVATNAFTAKGGDNFDVLEKVYKEGRVTDLGLSDWENFAEHLKSLTTVPSEVEGRIIDVKAGS